MIQRDREGSTAPGSLELLMRSPPPLVFLESVSVRLFLSFSSLKSFHSLLSTWVLHPSPFISLSALAIYPVTPSTSDPSLPPCVPPRHRFRPSSSSSSSIPTM